MAASLHGLVDSPRFMETRDARTYVTYTYGFVRFVRYGSCSTVDHMSEDLTVQCRCGVSYNMVESDGCPACHARPGRRAVIALTGEEAGILAVLVSEAADRHDAAGRSDSAELRHALARRLFQIATPDMPPGPGDSISRDGGGVRRVEYARAFDNPSPSDGPIPWNQEFYGAPDLSKPPPSAARGLPMHWLARTVTTGPWEPVTEAGS